MNWLNYVEKSLKRDELFSHTIAELRNMCDNLGLDNGVNKHEMFENTGIKENLVERLLNYYASK